MPVVALAGQKGGAGKTTLAVNLAVEGHRAGRSVVLIDVDPQATAAKWADRRGLPTPRVISAQAERLDQALAAAKAADLVVVDVAGKADRELLAVARRADVLLLPCRPTIADIEALDAARDILKLAGSKRAYAILNGVNGPRDSRAAQAADLITDKGIEVAPVIVCQRVLFGDAMIGGQGVSEVDANAAASKESQRMYQWLEGILGE